ncbi:GTPase [Thermoactinospora rubra]|uniref:GTPase n=1 Tax=Thermoactinospora rubra TaxID=1088767 RepID=UPI000A10C3AA|nr:GTPase [Thermoactinospora rubra]
MKLLRGRQGPALDERLEALATAADLAEGRLPADVVAQARAVVSRAGVRRSLSVDHTVVALAGATGSGKSSLFNALAGEELAAVGVIRPTTAAAQAAMWDGQGSGPLLDWLGVPRRHERSDPDFSSPDFSGLILLDLPDHDSIEVDHRLEVDRLVELVDGLVWVVDPQKYADAALHDRYLRPLAAHRDVMVVALNQIDRLPDDAVERCVKDLRRLLDDDGLEGVPVVPISVRTGAGLPRVRALLAERVAARTAWASRLAADVVTAADRLEAASAAPHPEPAKGGVVPMRDKTLTRALAQAAGVPLVVGAVAKAHRHRAVAATGWPVTRWLRRLRPDPLRRLRVQNSGDGSGDVVGRTSIPAAPAVQKSRLDTAIRDAGEAAARELPPPWAAAVRQAARSRSGELADVLDRTVATTVLAGTRRPRWWRFVGAVQWLLLATMLAGILWLTVLFVMDYALLPEPPTPTVWEVPWPTALVLGGVVAGLLVALLSRLAAWLGGRRRARKTSRALHAAIAEVARDYVLMPAEEERARYEAFEQAVARARRS